MLVWLIVYAMITLLLYGIQDWLQPLPIYLRTLVLSGMMVFGLQYLIFPSLQKWQNNTH